MISIAHDEEEMTWPFHYNASLPEICWSARLTREAH